jgi:hypothetical protein
MPALQPALPSIARFWLERGQSRFRSQMGSQATQSMRGASSRRSIKVADPQWATVRPTQGPVRAGLCPRPTQCRSPLHKLRSCLKKMLRVGAPKARGAVEPREVKSRDLRISGGFLIPPLRAAVERTEAERRRLGMGQLTTTGGPEVISPRVTPYHLRTASTSVLCRSLPPTHSPNLLLLATPSPPPVSKSAAAFNMFCTWSQDLLPSARSSG